MLAQDMRLNLLDPNQTIQIGIRAAMDDLSQDDWAHDEGGYRIIENEEFNDMGVNSMVAKTCRIVGAGAGSGSGGDKPTYISWDLDVLEIVYAPAVADPETDEMSINDAVKLMRGLRGINIMGADIVYYVPHLDTTRSTALNTSSILHEIVTVTADRVSKNHTKV